jgi:integrase
MPKSSKRSAAGKASKPHPDFPLFRHQTGRWAKKVRGKHVYFGKVADDPDGQAALELWLVQKDALLAGRTPRADPAGLTIRELLDRFMVSKRHLLDTREVTPRRVAELYATCRRIGDAFGMNRPVEDLAADDFERLRKAIAKTWGPVRLGNEVQNVRGVFKFGHESGLIAQPVRFGPAFKKPSRKVMRLNRAKNGPRMFGAEDLRKIVDAAGVPLKAMILLGINCGFGNTDVACLPIKALDLDRQWVDFPRPKTGISRRCLLWSETVAAIRDALRQRPRPKDKADEELAFVTKYGGRWIKAAVSEPDPDTGKIKMQQDNPVGKEFAKLVKAAGLHRPGLGFYALRHTFETIGGGSRDQVAVDAIMGHAREDMASLYREEIGDDRLRAVVDHIHQWLFAPKPVDEEDGESAERAVIPFAGKHA